MEPSVEIEEEDREALSGLSPVPAPPRKVYSYSQQLVGPSNSYSSSSPSSSQRRRNRPRKHSMDDIPFSTESGGAAALLPQFSDDEDDEDFFSHPPEDEFLPEEISRECQSLPEFIGSGGNVAPFKAPTRAAVHPGRPPCLELRPHPLRETQAGKFLRNIACTETQLWAGLENGIRVWSIDRSYEAGRGLGSGKVRRGDEDAAPFHESVNTPPTMCLVVDEATKMVWSGHKDGKIRSWKMDQPLDNDTNIHVKESLAWQAHKGPVLSLIVSSCGDLWSGGEGGNIKIWPWEIIEKSLNLSAGEKRMAALLVERSAIDLRSQVTVNGQCNLSSSDVKCLVSDHVKSKVWCAQSMSFSLWDARTKELIKVFNIEGQIENRADMPSAQQPEPPAEDDMKVKFVTTTKKEKSGGFLQRSRNAIIGAADAVRRVATRGAGAFAEDNKRTEALVVTADGMIWSGCSNGLLVQWDAQGNRLQDFNHHAKSVQCFCTRGDRIYVGYASGTIQMLDLEGNVLATWVAHSNPVLKLAVGKGYVFSLASHGGIRGWSVTSPGPVDSVIRSELAEKEGLYSKTDSLRILVGTWNVGQGKPVHEALMSWLGSATSDVGIVVVGLQEVEMGAGFLAMSAAKETVGLEGSAIGQLWLDAMGKALDEGTTFERMGSRQLAGLLISLWVRKSLRTHVGDVDAGAVPCGFGRAIGNKGGVGLRIRVLDRIITFVNCHLAAHLEAVNKRNTDFDHIYRNMAFTRSSNLTAAGMARFLILCCSLAFSTYLFWMLYVSGLPWAPSLAASVSANATTLKAANLAANANSEEASRPDLADADMVVFLGDFNYRLFGISYDEARDFVSQRSFDWLREKDQLRAEMKAGKVFQGMREAIIRFPPTYKFEKHQPGLAGYDSGEKKRIPAWCDRVIYRDNRVASVPDCSLECPIVSSIILYEACMDVTESDHKPVRCKFHIKISHVDRSVRRVELGKIVSSEKVKSLIQELCYTPETVVSTNKIVLQNQEASTLRITNKSVKGKAVFRVVCQGQSTIKDDFDKAEFHPIGCYGFPRWLEVTPAGGVIETESFVEVSLRNEEVHTLEELVDGIPQNWWSEDTRDKEVILVVIVQGSCSMEMTTHSIHVHHSLSGKPAVNVPSKASGNSQKNQT